MAKKSRRSSGAKAAPRAQKKKQVSPSRATRLTATTTVTRPIAVTTATAPTIAVVPKVGTATTPVKPGVSVTPDVGVSTGPVLVTPVNPGVFAVKFTRRVIRPRDLLVLDFTFFNLRVQSMPDGSRQLVRTVANKPSYIVVGFPPQHLLEQAFFEDAPEAPLQGPPPGAPPQATDPDKASPPGPEEPTAGSIPVQSRLADSSRLVFRLAANFSALPYTLEAVLDCCRNSELSVAASATPPEPKFTLRPGWETTIATSVFTSPSISSVAVGKVSPRVAVAPKKVAAGAAKLSRAAVRAAATQAVAATVLAETRNRWYSKRSPLARDLASQAEIAQVDDLWTKLAILPKLALPEETETAIEAPTRVILSPNVYGAWVHALNPVESSQSSRVELWHTRLAVRGAGGVTEADDFRRAVRAIWSPDANIDDPFTIPSHPVPPSPFRASLDRFDRHNLVHLSANHQLFIPNTQPKRRHKPLPIDVDRLMLSSLGAWLNIRGAWDPPAPLSVEEWRHRATLGRDHYVRVVYAGALYPFGHRASLVKVTERKFHPGVAGNPAFLRQRMFIVVREPYRVIGNTGFKVSGDSLDLKLPLKSARLTTLVTPNLELPELGKCAVVATVSGNNPEAQSIFWPHVGGPAFRFHLQFEDESGAKIDTTAPLFFVGDEKLTPGNELIPQPLAELLAARYSTHAPFETFRRVDLAGQRVQFAPTNKPGDTSFEVRTMEFELHAVNGKLVPAMQNAAVTVPSLKHLTKNQSAPEVKFPAVFLKGGFAPSGANKNPGEVFLELITSGSSKVDFSSHGDRSGALLAPNISISGLSRSLGPVGGTIDKIAKDGLDPADFFNNLGDMLPKLFGCIKITDILSFVGLGDLSKLPRFVSESLSAAEGLIDDANRMLGHVSTLQGQLAGLGAQLTAVSNAAGDVITTLGALLTDPLNGAKRDAFKAAFNALVAAAKSLQAPLATVAAPEPVAFAKTQLLQLLTKLSGGLEQAADVIAMADQIADTLEALSEMRIKFEWKPDLKSWPSSNPIFEVLPGGGLVIAVEMSAAGAGSEPSFDVACRLQRFDLNLIAPETFLKLHFKKIEFTASSRKKPDVNVDFGGIEFVGVLSFVESLRSLIPLDGFSDPPYLEVTEQGIEAGFSIGLPNIAIGVFSLCNLSLGASFTVPFLGQQPLSVRFNFCERSDPFRLTVWIFGGGGFFAVTVTPAGVQILEAAFEFGAAASIDFGVASGSISVMAGIYYRMEATDASLTGYFNLKGRVSVLGLITASLELALELRYEFASGKCVGRASLIIEIEILFFSASVEIVCEKKLAGANGDPSFLQIMAPYDDPSTGAHVEPWQEYCEAYAA
ncbi:hypothetical protein [Horticoccus sp. 23ND18S-11]|uniref:hypothetical protein n=1 Tax=Horticoccus sp. 23ND18S-11 TaxID=3391832 RepID=UPI0039C98050